MEARRSATALVLYHSKMGGTRKVARMIAQGLGCRALSVEESGGEKLEGYDLLVLGSPLHGDRPSDPVKAFLAEARALPGTAAVFCVAAADDTFAYSPIACLDEMSSALEGRGARIIETFRTRGENSDPSILEWLRLNMPERYPGALASKGHPDATELEAAQGWGKRLLEELEAPSRD